MGQEKVARLPFCACPCYCINFSIYTILRTLATFSQNGRRAIFRGPLCIYTYIYICKIYKI